MFFVFINIKKYEIYPCKLFGVCFILIKLKCDVFGLELDLNKSEHMTLALLPITTIIKTNRPPPSSNTKHHPSNLVESGSTTRVAHARCDVSSWCG